VKVVQVLEDSGLLWVLVFTALPVIYMLPTLVGAVRRVDGLALVCLVNLIGAPTGVISSSRVGHRFDLRRLVVDGVADEAFAGLCGLSRRS
jgi:hypothetical protein